MQHQRGGHHHNGGHHGGLSNQQPDLLPPPDGFDNTMPRQNIYPIGKKFMPWKNRTSSRQLKNAIIAIKMQ